MLMSVFVNLLKLVGHIIMRSLTFLTNLLKNLIVLGAVLTLVLVALALFLALMLPVYLLVRIEQWLKPSEELSDTSENTYLNPEDMTLAQIADAISLAEMSPLDLEYLQKVIIERSLELSNTD